MIKPPFNYTGNKNRLVEEFSTNFFPKNKNLKFIDVFGGGATISINVDYQDITYNDKNDWVVPLLKIFKKRNIDEILDFVKYTINKYDLSSTHYFGNTKYQSLRSGNNGLKDINLAGFRKLREDINKQSALKTDEYFLNLLVASFYSFNNDIRFNSKGFLNIPIGKTDFNTNTYNKLITFIEAFKRKKIKIKNKDFIKLNTDNYDFFYLDPPYLGTVATYNSSWSVSDEMKLYDFITEIDSKNKSFILSNMTWMKGVENKRLIEFAKNNNFKIIELNYSYKSSSYNRERLKKDQEVIITNVKNI